MRKYASAYSTILSKKGLKHIYIDAFAAAGEHVSKATGEWIAGSPSNALHVSPPFAEYHFIDLDSARVENLRRLAGARADVYIYEQDCNRVLLEHIFPTLEFVKRRRALCLLDPYGLSLQWRVIYQAGQLGTIDMFLNFPVMGMNRYALWRNPTKAPAEGLARRNSFGAMTLGSRLPTLRNEVCSARKKRNLMRP